MVADESGREVVATKGEAVGKLTGINHLVLIVPDMDRTLKFYRDLLGLEVVKTLSAATLPDGRTIGRNYFFQLGDGSMVGLVEYQDAVAPSGPIYPGTVISNKQQPLWPGATGAPVDPQKMDHLAFNVDTRAELEWFQQRLRDNGVAVSEIIEYQEKNGAQFVISIYFFDPFGNPLEIATFDLADPNAQTRMRRDLWFADENPPAALFE